MSLLPFKIGSRIGHHRFSQQSDDGFRISVKPNQTRIDGRIAGIQRSRIRSFINDDVGLPSGTVITAHWTEQRFLKLNFSKEIDAGLRQRVRNYLLAVLN